MSATSKRDVEEAFGTSQNSSPHSTKRKKRARSSKSNDAQLNVTLPDTNTVERTKPADSNPSKQEVRKSDITEKSLATIVTPSVDRIKKRSRKRKPQTSNAENNNELQIAGPEVESNLSSDVESNVNTTPGQSTEKLDESVVEIAITTTSTEKKGKRRQRKPHCEDDLKDVNGASDDKKFVEKSKPLVEKQTKVSQELITMQDKSSRASSSGSALVQPTSSKLASQETLGDVEQENGWKMSTPIGGTFLNHDPVMTLDGSHLILPTKTDIQVYSVATSLLIRTLSLGFGNEVVSCAISPKNSNLLIVGGAEGQIYIFDWTEGSLVSGGMAGGSLSAVVSVNSVAGEEQFLLMFDSENEERSLLSLTLDSKGLEKQSDVLLQKRGLFRTIFAFAEFGVVVLCSPTSIFIGYASHRSKVEISLANLVWKEVSIPSRMVSFDVRVVGYSGQKIPNVHVVVGLKSGMICVYTDLLTKVILKEKGKKVDISGRKLHWHRRQVNTVRWSQDVNYIISGGEETALVIWQLDTNEKQFLPHLSTPILNLTVSQAGSAYALRLADNSVMVLSTTDLQPSANVSGLSLGPEQYPPIALHPTRKNQFLVAVSADAVRKSKEATSGATLLQTYDYGAKMQLSRQALARNMTTTVKVGPSGQPISEPTVTNLKISGDGTWLATIDRWSSIKADLQALYLNDGDDLAKLGRSETYLRFWSFNIDEGIWELNTRVDEPTQAQIGTVVAIASNPSRSEFVTAGSDGCIKIWIPKARSRSGIAIKDQAGRQLYTWTCARILTLGAVGIGPSASVLDEVSAAIAYSEDGSSIAVSWSVPGTEHRLVHIIDSRTGNQCATIPNLVTAGNACLSFSGRFLLALSQKFCSFDLISMRTKYMMQIDAKYDKGNLFLAAQPNRGIVALAVNPRYWAGNGKVIIYDVNALEKGPLQELIFPGQTRALLASTNGQGFIIVDSEARVRHVMPTSSSDIMMETVDVIEPVISTSLAGIFGSNTRLEDGGVPMQNAARMIENGKQTSWEDVLDVPSTAKAPFISELFSKVAQLVSVG